MASAAFDTFQAARALESAGVDRAQAEVIAEAIQQRQDHATTSDLAAFGSQLRAVRGELRTELCAFEKRMAIRLYVGGAGLAAWIIACELFAWRRGYLTPTPRNAV